ncbi:MAG: protease modulator HflK [Deltaproteobacteria bacterium]|nr:protease modulator HflK [Deltaproteobacteria bacterium]
MVLAWLATGFYTVRASEGEIGVATALGRVVADHVPPGVHWNWPWPLGRAARVKVAEPLTMSVGYRISDDLRGLNPTPAETQWLSGNTNIVEVRAVLQYVVEDPAAYLYGGAEQAGLVLRRAAEAAFTEVLGAIEVDRALTSGQNVVLEKVKAATNQRLVAYSTGIRVVTASFKSIDPASPVRSAFRQVQDAEAERGRLVNAAKGYSNDLLPKARGEARGIVTQAKAAADARIQATTRRDRSVHLGARRVQARPQRTRERLYLEALEEILPRVRVVVSDGDANGKDVDLHLLQPP